MLEIIVFFWCETIVCVSTVTLYFKDEDVLLNIQYLGVDLVENKTEITQKSIMQMRLYNFDPLKPHFYIVKLGFTGVYIIFFISAQKHRFGYLLEPPGRGSSNEYPQSMFWAEVWKI